MTEFQHQAALIKWSQQPSIRSTHPELALLFHIPNGGARDAVEGRHLKAAGVKAGVPDLFLPCPRGEYAGLWIELKADNGRLSAEQSWWLEKLAAEGYSASVAHGWEAAIRTIEWYLNLGGVQRGRD